MRAVARLSLKVAEGVKVASYSVAINNGKNAQGEEIAPIWIRISVWRNNVKMGNHGVSNLRVGAGKQKTPPTT